VLEFLLKHDPHDSLGSWRLVVEARFSSDDPREALEAARRALREAADGLDGLLTPAARFSVGPVGVSVVPDRPSGVANGIRNGNGNESGRGGL